MHAATNLPQQALAAASQPSPRADLAFWPPNLDWLVSPLMIAFWVVLALFGLGLFRWARRAYQRDRQPWPPFGP